MNLSMTQTEKYVHFQIYRYVLVCAYAPERDAYIDFFCPPNRLLSFDAKKDEGSELLKM